MGYFVYIVECKDASLYVGCTNNLEKRMKRHNHSKAGAHYTKTRRPVVLRYVEPAETLSAALKREYAVKQLSRRQKLELLHKAHPRKDSTLKHK